MVKFVVREKNGSEKDFKTVQEAFAAGGANVQAVGAREIQYPAAFVVDDEGRRYGPVLRP
jgi:hypothetical protein